MRFFLNFLSDTYGRKEIDCPIGMSEIDFSVKQEQNRMARDFTLNGDTIEFEFSYMRNHELKQLLYYFNNFGFESKVQLEIKIDELNTYVCDLDFAQASTDDLEYFKCKGLLVADRQIIKRRKSVKVDLYSDKNVDGDYIGKLVPDNTLIKATPLIKISTWEQTEPFGYFANKFGGGVSNYGMNPANNLVKSGIDDTLSPKRFASYYSKINDFELIYAKTNLKNIKVSITDLDFKATIQGSGSGNPGWARVTLRYYIGNRDADNYFYYGGGIIDTSNILINDGDSYTNNKPFTFTIDEIQAGYSIFLFYSLELSKTYNDYNLIRVLSECKSMKVEISANSTSYNSVVPSVSLYDAMKQVIKSISGLDIVAPRFKIGGDLYGNRLMNGNALRNIPNKPFNISLEDIENSLGEMKCDYEITPDGKVFFGGETDFYTSNEIGFFPNTQFSEMSKTFNPLYSVNEFYFNYKKYQALKENTLAGTADTIHGESRYVFHNKKVENKKVVDVEWCRDILIIEELRKIGLKIEENTSTQEDDDVFILDCIATTTDQLFTESFELRHNYENEKLVLRNDGTFNFVVLGIYAGSAFEILAPDKNTAKYTVFASSPNELILTRVSAGSNSSVFDGIRTTKISYTIDDAVINFTNRTNQGFDTISNLNAGDKASNLRYSIGRNIRNFWWSYLSTVNLYWKGETIKNNFYKNNGECTTVYDGITVKEKEDIKPNNPIVTPMMYNKMIFSNVEFLDYVNLQNNLRSQRGFIRAIDNNEKVIKVYATELTYSMLDRELIVKGEEKYEPITMNISTANPYILINNETTADSVITEIIGEKVYIYDLNRQLLYNGVFWFEVAVNGFLSRSKEELKSLLKLLP